MTRDCFLQHMAQVENGYELGGLQFVVLVCMLMYIDVILLLSLQGSKGSASLKFDTEKEVFDFLGFPWLEPNQRNL